MAETMTAEQKVKKYEALLEELMNNREKREGRILAGPENGLYKVKVGNDEIIAASPAIKVKVHDAVIMINGTIFEILPEGLKTVETEEEVNFEHITWDNVGGMRSQIEAIRRKVDFPVKFRSVYKEFNLHDPKGILLYGPPGCGKTLIAKAIASSMLKANKVNKNLFVYLKGGELLDRYVGSTENRIKSIFDSARNTYKTTGVRPIIFIDEAEAILPPRGSRISSDVENTIVPTFLSEMDGFESNTPFVILATNYIDGIDKAIQRAGRIDLKIYVGRPSFEDAIDIFKIHLSKTKQAEKSEILSYEAAKYLFSMDKLLAEVSGAMIENIVSSAIEIAIMRKINNPKEVVGVNKDDLLTAINNQ